MKQKKEKLGYQYGKTFIHMEDALDFAKHHKKHWVHRVYNDNGYNGFHVVWVCVQDEI